MKKRRMLVLIVLVVLILSVSLISFGSWEGFWKEITGRIIVREVDCEHNCSSLGYECGVHTFCEELINCGICREGEICQNIKCSPQTLLAHYKFEETTRGNTLDYSENNYFGKVYGASITEGVSGKAYKFNGANTYVYIGHKLSKEIKNSFTIASWIKLDKGALQKPFNYVFWKGDDRPGLRIKANGEVSFTKYHSGNGCCLDSGINLIEKKWYYLTYTFNGSMFKSYINGKFVRSLSDNFGRQYSPGGVVLIGSDTGIDNFFKGTIDEFKIWNYALNESQIQQEYNSIISLNQTL